MCRMLTWKGRCAAPSLVALVRVGRGGGASSTTPDGKEPAILLESARQVARSVGMWRVRLMGARGMPALVASALPTTNGCSGLAIRSPAERFIVQGPRAVSSTGVGRRWLLGATAPSTTPNSVSMAIRGFGLHGRRSASGHSSTTRAMSWCTRRSTRMRERAVAFQSTGWSWLSSWVARFWMGRMSIIAMASRPTTDGAIWPSGSRVNRPVRSREIWSPGRERFSIAMPTLWTEVCSSRPPPRTA